LELQKQKEAEEKAALEAKRKLELQKQKEAEEKAALEAKRKLEFQKQKEAEEKAALEAKRKLEFQKQKEAEDKATTKLESKKVLEIKKRRESAIKAERAVISQQIKQANINDSIAKARKKEAQKLIELKKQNDSIAKIIEKERKELEALRRTTALAQNALNAQPEEEMNAEAMALAERMKYRNECHYQINDYDRFYNITTKRTEEYSISNKLTAELYQQGVKSNVFFNLSEDLGCASYLPNQRSSLKITLENNRTVTFYHSWDIECGDVFHFKAILTNDQKSVLKSSPIKSIVLRGTKGTKDINFIEYKEFFMDKLKCID
ncbi:hypothetical protein, partial [Algibacter pectinivorans]